MSWWESSYEPDEEPLPASYRLEVAMDTLTAKQRFVVELRFGLKDGEFYTFEEIAECMGVSIQAVAKLEQKALKNLDRH